MDDLETLRRAQLLLGQYGFVEEQEAVAKAVRIITATAKRLGVMSDDRARVSIGEPGERLKRLRERVGLTRAQVAAMCGVAMSTVRSHENGEAKIPEEAARAYAQALGAPPGTILYGGD
jgi:DNA-binding transcriptional regulator YiaG